MSEPTKKTITAQVDLEEHAELRGTGYQIADMIREGLERVMAEFRKKKRIVFGNFTPRKKL